MYPVSREPLTVQPMDPNNTNNSALLDLPNVNTNLPLPLTPQQTMQNQVMTDATNVMSQPTQQPPEGLIATIQSTVMKFWNPSKALQK